MDQEWDGSAEEFRVRLEVRIEDANVVALGHIVVTHSLLQSAGFVAVAVATDLVPDVDPFARRPSLYLHLH